MLRIVNITAPDINNGNGIRITLWVSGCTHHCKGCHNQWTWNFNQGRIFNIEQKEIFEELSNWLDRDYVEGLTLSGGDPLCQDKEGLCELLQIINWFKNKYPQKNIWLYTGYTIEKIKELNNDLINEIINSIDVLVDGPYIEEKRDVCHTPFRGSTNQRIIYTTQ